MQKGESCFLFRLTKDAYKVFFFLSICFYCLFSFKHQYWKLLHLDKILVAFYIRMTVSQVETQIF